MTLGRGSLPEEEDYRAPKAVVIISERVWHEYFGSDPAYSAPRFELATARSRLSEWPNVGSRRSEVDSCRSLVTAPGPGVLADWMGHSRPGQLGTVFGRLRAGRTAEEARQSSMCSAGGSGLPLAWMRRG